MPPEHATSAQRVGSFLALLGACLFGFAAALHLGAAWTIGGTTFAAPFLYPVGILEALLAVGLFVSVVLPGAGAVRVGRVLAAQILSVIGVFAGQVALLRGPELTAAHNEIFYGVVLILALASIVLLASPVFRRRPLAR